MVAYGIQASVFIDPSPMADTKPPPHLKHNPPPQLSSPPQVSSRPSVLPQARRLLFLALKNVGVLSQGPQQHSSPITSRPPEHTSPEHPQEGTPRGHPGVHGCIPGRPLPHHPPQAGSGRPSSPGGGSAGPTRTCQAPMIPRPGSSRGVASAGWISGSPQAAARPLHRPPQHPPLARAPRVTFLLSRTIRSSLGSS